MISNWKSQECSDKSVFHASQSIALYFITFDNYKVNALVFRFGLKTSSWTFVFAHMDDFRFCLTLSLTQTNKSNIQADFFSYMKHISIINIDNIMYYEDYHFMELKFSSPLVFCSDLYSLT